MDSSGAHVEQQMEENRGSRGASLWKAYRQFASKHHDSLLFAEDCISRLLLWTPLSDESPTSLWREVVWGLLELHRLLAGLALRVEPLHSSFGASVSVSPGKLPATSLRLALTVLQSISPVAQAVVTTKDNNLTASRQAKVRLYLERVRFVVRATLLIGYWRRMAQAQRQRQGILPGLLLEGGLFHAQEGPGIRQEQAKQERQMYIGRRTGRRLTPGGSGGRPSTTEQDSKLALMRIVLGELLYILRPLIQAQVDASEASSMSSWCGLLSMDVASLWSLRDTALGGNNQVTRQEWERRRLRLWLYLLRSPCWDCYAVRPVERVSSAVDRIPLLGRFLTSYLWDWLYYWKQYRAEEG